MYRYGIKNVYRPSQLAPKAYGWQKGAGYEQADVPTRWAEDTGLSDTVLKQQFAYEWFQSGDTGPGFTANSGLSGNGGLTNPPFLSGAAGRLHPALTDANGKPARILRGYIRRAEYDVKDMISKTRLYFMYNPEMITREYVSYLEQSALDPFNTVYQSGNLIAPPSILNFSFELFFDRQEEAMNVDHPGVFVDYQFFDMVVRNVIPQDPNQTNSAIPDNGVMMVNPRDITVVFSPQLTVQGRPTNASVQFEKFTHRMVPTRMRIQLQILASYFGPVRDMVEYKAEELPAEESIPIDEFVKSVFDLTYDDVENASTGGGATADDAISTSRDGWNPFTGNEDWFSGDALFKDMDLVHYGQQVVQNRDGNAQIRLQAMDWAANTTVSTGPEAGPDIALRGVALPASITGAALVTRAYNGIGHGSVMGWTSNPGTSGIISAIKQATSRFTKLADLDWKKDLSPGDILIKDGYAAFFVKYNGSSGCLILDRPGFSQTAIAGTGTFTHLLRPTPLGSTGSAAQSSNYNQPTNVVDAGVLAQSQTVVAETGQGNNIRLSPAAIGAWNQWRSDWGGPIPCSSGWRDPIGQQAAYLKEPKRFAPAASSYHCKGLAVDVDMNWLGALSANEQSRFRLAAIKNGWGQPRWRKTAGQIPGYEAGCNCQKGNKTDEPWHFSWGGCG